MFIDTTEFNPRPWAKREDGFVTVGRIERSKCIDELIRIVERVRERDHDIHIHIIGPMVGEEYHAEIAEMAADRDYIDFEGEVPRDDLIKRLCTHKYGIHGKKFEHFGMAVVELAAVGTVTFVPASGGLHAIVDDNEAQLFESPEDAIEKISAMASDPTKQRRCRMTISEVERRFGRERFRKPFREIIGETLLSDNNR
ncbi:hypothetical protein DMJ13_21320 [halophilic archaeon]|nr:hypothetical protein DMJ13_21320 [halophilic archaeon]